MRKKEIKPPTVFISYSHDSENHKKRVREFSDRLIRDRINAIFDGYVGSPPEGWARWSERRIRESDFVIVICTAIELCPQRSPRREIRYRSKPK